MLGERPRDEPTSSPGSGAPGGMWVAARGTQPADGRPIPRRAAAPTEGRPMDSSNGVRRIAVLRCNALGDYLMATPALAALRAAFPEAEITLLAAAWHAAFLGGRPGPV